MAERVDDAAEAPAVLVGGRVHDGRARCPGSLDRRVRVADDEEQRTLPPPSDSGLKFPCAGASSETQNDAPPTDSWATTSGWSSVPPTR